MSTEHPANTPPPSLKRTYKRADGELIIDEYAWVTDLDQFDDEEYPVELIEETWERASVRRFWHFPDKVYSCEIETGEGPCDEDAVKWWQSPDGVWLQVCPKHRDDEADPDPSGDTTGGER